MSVERTTETAERGAQPGAPAPVSQASVPTHAAPAEILARVARDRGDRRLAIAVAAAGNRYMQGVAARQLARAPVAQEVGSYVDPDTDPVYARIVPLCNRSPWGREALAALKQYQVKTFFATDGPVANFAQQLNRVRLNTGMRDDVLSSYFVHEMYHASQFHEGKSPGPSSHDDKGKWVQILVDEEIEGTARGYLHKLQLERTAPRAPADDNPAHMGRFRSAFDYAYKAAIDAGKDVDAAREAGRANARKLITWLVMPGDNTMPELGPSAMMGYKQYYELEWQRAHRSAAPTSP